MVNELESMMKLTKDEDVEFPLDSYWFEGKQHEIGYIISINLKGKTREEAKEVWKKILENQTKASEWDKFNNEVQGNLALSFKRTNKLEKENNMFLCKIGELAEETKQRGLIIGKKDEEIKQLKEIERRYNLRLHRIVTLEKHNKELVQELNESLQKLEKLEEEKKK